jgi:N-acetylmuramoyl-L-alanine amidase
VPEPVTHGPVLQHGDHGDKVLALQTLLQSYGYDVAAHGIFDDQTRNVVRSFQMHFRPALVDGIADQSTVTTLQRLVDAL